MQNEKLLAIARRQPYSLLFATVSGAHLYGFPSPDSDYDLRGAHIVPAGEVFGLNPIRETIEESLREDGVEMDIVTHDVRKFFLLMLKRNGYVLEQIHSPHVVHSTPEFEELREIARGCVTRFHAQHYLGFFETQWRLFEKKRRAKALLYCYRVLLTGIHLMRTGEVEANLVTLNNAFRLPHVDDLLAFKAANEEKAELADADFAFHQSECWRLRGELEAAQEASSLPNEPSAASQLNELLVRLRRASL